MLVLLGAEDFFFFEELLLWWEFKFIGNLINWKIKWTVTGDEWWRVTSGENTYLASIDTRRCCVSQKGLWAVAASDTSNVTLTKRFHHFVCVEKTRTKTCYHFWYWWKCLSNSWWMSVYMLYWNSMEERNNNSLCWLGQKTCKDQYSPSWFMENILF